MTYAAKWFDYNDTDSNRRALKSAYKRLIINYFKVQLIHFNGTIVKRTI